MYRLVIQREAAKSYRTVQGTSRNRLFVIYSPTHCMVTYSIAHRIFIVEIFILKKKSYERPFRWRYECFGIFNTKLRLNRELWISFPTNALMKGKIYISFQLHSSINLFIRSLLTKAYHDETERPTALLPVTCPDRDSNPSHLLLRPDALNITPQHRKLPSICSYWVEGKPRKNLNQVTCPDRDSNPDHLVSRKDALTITPQEYCVCPQNMPQFDSEGIPNQAPETNKAIILNGPTSRNREDFRSGERGGQAIAPPLPIHRSGNLRSKYRRAVRQKCAGAPSCKKCMC
ncbi:hypothetical protein ANN_03102 [Periplaneta americana]|uniref:Uncharacterized protein n=1 Tax=Periplaneta americana TaxID=6978 RepID=A0ABQ8TY82_PERAM|nr:hypothetical protein ANN_03102 [Periplaneta americana]